MLAWGRLQRVGAVALVALPLGLLGVRACHSPDFPFLWRDAGAPWIMAPVPPSAQLEQWGRADVPVVTFSRVFRVPGRGAEGDDAPARLRLRALRGVSVHLNGEPVPGASQGPERWRELLTADLSQHLRPGRNELAVRVTNRRGPALLSLTVSGLPDAPRSDRTWSVAMDGTPLGSAVPADDTRVNPAGFAVETPLEALAAKWRVLLGLAGLGAVAFALGRGRVPPERLPRIAIAAAVLLWVAYFATTFAGIPLPVGFDARHHLAYVDWLRDAGTLPLATDGWSTYHPPLFYAASAGLAAAGELLSGASGWRLGLKLLPWAAGLGSVFVAGALCRRLLPGDRKAEAAAVLFAAVLPMNATMSAYFSNESLHAFLGGLALLLVVEALVRPDAGAGRAAAAGAVVGLALLTKFTAAVVAAVGGFFLFVAALAVDRAGPARALARAGTFAAAALAVAGWFYARNWLELGRPLVGNWDLPGPDRVWWQQPGFHTPAYYLTFGEALVHPYLAGFHSFWDGIYSTLWGDGDIAGRVFPSDRHGHLDYGFMSAVYLLALPATALLAAGGWLCARAALTSGVGARRRAALSCVCTAVFAVGFATLWMTVRLPFFGQAKAFYALVATGPLAVFFGAALSRLDATLAGRGWHPARAAGAAWLAAFAGASALAFLA